MNEADKRILTFLSQTGESIRYATYISAKLEIDYTRTVTLLKRLEINGFITGVKDNRRVYYFLTPLGNKALSEMQNA